MVSYVFVFFCSTTFISPYIPSLISCSSLFLLPFQSSLWGIFCHFFYSVHSLVNLFVLPVKHRLYKDSHIKSGLLGLYILFFFHYSLLTSLCTLVVLPSICIIFQLVYSFLCIVVYYSTIPYGCPGIFLSLKSSMSSFLFIFSKSKVVFLYLSCIVHVLHFFWCCLYSITL